MRSLAQLAGQELLWVQPAAHRRVHELRAGEDVVAALRFQRGSLADADADSDHWSFQRRGFGHPRGTALVSGSEANVAAFRPRWSARGTLERPDRRANGLSHP